MLNHQAHQAHQGGPADFQGFLDAAATTLKAQEWKLVRRDEAPDALWHLLVKKGHKYRVIQVLSPASTPVERQERRNALGDTVRLPANMGTMEQWLAHVRPDGHITFGPYLLNAQHWADTSANPLAALGIAA